MAYFSLRPLYVTSSNLTEWANDPFEINELYHLINPLQIYLSLEPNYHCLSQALDTLLSYSSSNLTELTKGVKMLSALLGEEGDGNSILDAAKGLMGAFSDLLKCAQPESQQVDSRHPPELFDILATEK